MKIIHEIDQLPEQVRGGAVTIGNFDGVHRGHAQIITRLIGQAKQIGGPAAVFTFDPHPVRLLRPEQAPPPLTWTHRKAELLAELGVDAMIVYPTDNQLLSLSPEQFFNQFVVEQLVARAVVEGVNFRFGAERAGTPQTMAKLCEAAGLSMVVVEPIEIDGEIVSSSRVRRMIAAGEVRQAARLLTHPYRIRGMVSHGAGRGATIGFPTANIAGIDTLLPAEGVYAARAIRRSDDITTILPAAVNIGANPTFGETGLKVEAHLLDFTGDLYDEVLELDFLDRVRDIQPFDSVDSLVEQLHRDVATTRTIYQQLTAK